MILNIIYRIIELIEDLMVRKTHDPLPETVAAVHGTPIGQEDQGGLRIFMLEAGHLGVLPLPARVVGTLGVQFLDGRDRHLPDGVQWIVDINEREIIGSDAHGMPLHHRGELFHFMGGQGEACFELTQGCDVVPEIVLRVRPPGRYEGFLLCLGF